MAKENVKLNHGGPNQSQPTNYWATPGPSFSFVEQLKRKSYMQL